MDILVKGGQTLSGELKPSGSKNSIVALIPASILFDKPLVFSNVPEISDVSRLIKIMEKLGSKIVWDKSAETLSIDNSNLRFQDLDKDDLGNMKGTSLLWGPMLARFRKVHFLQLPGGCTLGSRPLGPAYDAFLDLGVVIKNGSRQVSMDASRAYSHEIWLPEMSPTITENIVTFAVSLKGTTRIVGAASEPQVQDVCNFLIKCGAKINGVGSSILEIEGGQPLSAHDHEVLPDHYEITTFLGLAAITGGELQVHNAMPELFPHINYIFKKFNVEIGYKGNIAILNKGQSLRLVNSEMGYTVVRAQPWPSLPVDLLPIFIPLALASESGQALFHNWMYESGLFWTSELTKLGANIIMADPHRVIVSGGRKLHGAELEAPYIIRAVVSMVMSAIIADGETKILNADALYRGHPHFSENLKKLGVIVDETSR